jgi:hypothetical protein
MDKELLIRLDFGWPDELRVLKREDIRLRDELEWLDAVGAVRPLLSGDAPKDSKAADAFDVNSTLATLAASGGGLTSLVGVLLTWVQRDRRRSLSVWHAEDILALKGLLPDQPQHPLDAFLSWRTGPAG